MKTRVVALSSLMLVAAKAPAPADFRPVPTSEAIAYFKQICVDTMPSPAKFMALLNAERVWTHIDKNTARNIHLANFWRSKRGELQYQHLPNAAFLETNPGCHYSFRTNPDYDHELAGHTLAKALGLNDGVQTGKKKAPQTRWEGRLSNGLRVRLFLSSNVRDMGGPAATLSISAYRDQRPDR